MSSADTIRHSTRTRRALNDLQFASNGKDIVGLSPRKTNQIQLKKVPFTDFHIYISLIKIK